MEQIKKIKNLRGLNKVQLVPLTLTVEANVLIKPEIPNWSQIQFSFSKFKDCSCSFAQHPVWLVVNQIRNQIL